MREVRVLGGEHNGHVHFVDDWVDKIRMEVHKNEPLLKIERGVRYNYPEIEFVEYTILRLWSGEWVCVKL